MKFCAKPVAADGAKVQQYQCHGEANQEWETVSVGGSYFWLINQYSGKCLYVAGANMNDGAIIQQYLCHGRPNQRFNLQ